MIGQFDFSEKGWVSGKGRSAVWRDIPFEEKIIEPQFLMSYADYVSATDKNGNPKTARGLKPCYMDVGSATNSRAMISSAVWDFPCGNKVPLLIPNKGEAAGIALVACLDSFVFDYAIRNRLGGLTINYFIAEESPLPPLHNVPKQLVEAAFSLISAGNPIYSPVLESLARTDVRAAISAHERTRLRVIIDAALFAIAGLDWEGACHILKDCDLPVDQLSGDAAKGLNPKGFWRLGKGLPPELRHTVLSLVAFHDLQERGLEAFLAQNDGEGWMLPEQLRLADYGLGHDDRAQEYQPVASRMGPRFYEWQLKEDVERSWQECAAHAQLIRRIVPLPQPLQADGIAEAQATYKTESPQGALF